MNRGVPVRVIRRSPGRLRVHAPTLGGHERAGLARVAAADGVLEVRLSERTGNLLIEFDRSLLDESRVIALIAAESSPQRPSRRPRQASVGAEGAARAGWRRAGRTETVHARPAACVAALIDFERYPEWQTYVTAVTIVKRDERGRGICVATQARVGEREIRFTTIYRFPRPNRIVFEQHDGELDAVRGSWTFRSVGGGRTRATFVVEVKPGWRLNVLLRGPMYEQIRDAALDHFMSELRERVESGRH